MKRDKQKFIKKNIIFLIILIVLLTVSNLLYINQIEKKKQIIRKDIEWQAYKKELTNNTLDYAFFGDSHTRNGLNPKFINNSFNFGVGSQDYIETYFTINKLLYQDNIKISCFILEIDTHTFSDGMRIKGRLFRNLGYYYKFVPVKEIANLKGESIGSVFIKSKLIIIDKGKEILSYLINPPILVEIKKGWINETKKYSKITNKEKNAKNKYYSHFSKNKNLFENTSLSYFIKILKLAKKNNISIVFIKYPLTYEYDLELKKHNISREQFYNRLFKIINKTNITYSVLDYYYLFPHKSEYFSDSDHLNYIGSEILSKKVAKDLKHIN